jgi:two-component system, LytTR family, response regulator
MIKALIVDDEEKACSILKTLLERYTPEITDIEIVHNAMDAFFKIKEWNPDLVFLDIQMPFMNGFDLLNKLEEVNFDIVFTTAFNQYAIQAIRFSALDYLLKPIDVEELTNAVQRFLQRRNSVAPTNLQYQNLVSNLAARKNDDFTLAIHGNQGMQFLKINEIIRLEGDRNYTMFYLSAERKHLASKTLKEYEELLSDKGFYRIHKSHLVNSIFVESLSQDGIVLMKDKSQVEVSRRRLPDIRKIFNQL